jgi:hypothetical protein
MLVFIVVVGAYVSKKGGTKEMASGIYASYWIGLNCVWIDGPATTHMPSCLDDGRLEYQTTPRRYFRKINCFSTDGLC